LVTEKIQKLDNKDIDIALNAAIKGGTEILKIYNDPNANFSIERKADNSPLTIADKNSHAVIQEQLQKTPFPVLSEEGKDIPYEERKNWKTFWMVDPLDGTKEFIKRNGEFTVNIALIEKDKPVLGIIYVPITNTLYFGIEGKGSFKIIPSSKKISFRNLMEKGAKLPNVTSNKIYYIVGSRSHMNEETKNYIDNLKNNHSQVEIITSGSSLKICLVAEGSANEYPRFGPTMEWDTAAGHAIARAAGKKLWFTNLTGELKYNKKNLLNPHFIVK
jgi:3'(2'), 5'-bisphosphate nucleotidase